MDINSLKGNPRLRVGIILLIFMAVALVLRLIPALFIKDTGFLYTMDSDTWYTIRQVEVMVNHFPQYDWFDPMTAFPTGKVVDWGPLFPFITAVLCRFTGATTPSSIIYVSSWVSPIMAALMVPVIYFIGKTVWNWKVGIVAAGLISVVSLASFSLTTFGLVIHHIGEALCSSLFFLVYLFCLVSVRCQMPDIKKIKNVLVPVALASLAGVLYFLALIMSTTTLLILVVIAIFTLVQNIVNHLTDRPSDNLLVLNLVFLSVSTILLVLFGFKQPGLSIGSYTIGLVYVNFAIIAETILCWGLSKLFQGKIKPYLILLGVLAIAGVAVIRVYPPLLTISQQGMNLLFGSSNYSVGVLNTTPLSLDLAWQYFNVALILAVGGFLVLSYYIVKKRKAEWIFLWIWTVFMLLLTVQYQRFAYFSTINVVLLSAICIIEPFSWKKTDGTLVSSRVRDLLFFHRTPVDERGCSSTENTTPPKKTNKTGKPKKQSRNSKNGTDVLKGVCLGAVILLAIVLVAVSVYNDANLALNNPHREISSDWVDSVNWLKTNTPSPGVDYFQHYDASTFSYPSEAYGILADWDAGHWITFFSHRIPITNPFQDHLGGSSGAYSFFLSQNESKADEILEGLGGRYVITDSKLAVDNLASLTLWANNSVDISPYISQFMGTSADDPSRLLEGYNYNEAYYRTMIVRLQNFDGSMQVPDTVNYIQYTIRQVPGAGETSGGVNEYARVITSEQIINISQSRNDTPIIREETDGSHQGTYANMFSDLPNRTPVNVPALKHYRLVHESPKNASVQMFWGTDSITLPDIKYVKIFEYVNGAHIPGNGIIEVPVITNTGRTFVYRQASENGTFIVPYSTSYSPYEVRTTGSYHILGTDRYFNVTEDDVMQGSISG